MSLTLSWQGKDEAARLAVQPATGNLRPSPATPHESPNRLIIGDNLTVLKLLAHEYSNRIRAIYIDPPYNTGNSFTYNDKAASCDDWCSGMYARLLAARPLLSADGVIFISIGDAELAHLSLIADEVFGQENRLGTFIWEKTQHFGRQKYNCCSNAEYILCYAKELFLTSPTQGKIRKRLLVERRQTGLLDAPLYNASNAVTELTFPAHSTEIRLPDGVYEDTGSSKYQLLNPVHVKHQRNSNAFTLRFRSRWSAETVLEQIAQGTVFVVKSANFAIRAVYSQDKTTLVTPRQIIFTNVNHPLKTTSRWDEKVGTTENASLECQKLTGSAFSYPKPVSLIKYLLSLLWDAPPPLPSGTHNHKHNSDQGDFARNGLILDFFGGSGTTAQAVWELNALDGGQRHFILVQQPEADICATALSRLQSVSQRQMKLAPELDEIFQIWQTD